MNPRWTKAVSVSFQLRLAQDDKYLDARSLSDHELSETIGQKIMSMYQNTMLKKLSFYSDENELLINGSITTNDSLVSNVVEFISNDEFKKLCINLLCLRESSEIEFSFSMDSNTGSFISSDENDSKKLNSGIMSNESRNGTIDGNIGNASNGGIDSKCEETKEDYRDEMESLFDVWYQYVNDGIGYIDYIIDYAIICVDSPQRRRQAFLDGLLIDNGGLIKSTCELTLDNESHFEKTLLLLNRLIAHDHAKMFKIFMSDEFTMDEIFMAGMIEHGENRFIVTNCLNVMDILINESVAIWRNFVTDKYNIGALLQRLVQYGDIELRKQEYLIIAIITLINGTFDKSIKLNYRHLRLIFNKFSEVYLDLLILIVEKMACDKISIEFCALMRFILKCPKVNMSKFENDLLFNKWYDFFKILLDIMLLQIKKDNFYGMNESMQVLILLLTNTENEDRVKEKLFKQEQFLNFELLLVDYLQQWKKYYKKGNNDFDTMLGYMIEFICVYFGNNKKYNNNILSLDYLNHVIPLASLRIEALAAGMECESKIYLWKVDFISPSDGSHSYAVNGHKTRKNILIPQISNDNDKNHVTSTMKSFGIRNRLFDCFGKYFVDTRHLYSFSQNDQSIFKFGNEFHKRVKITLRYVGCLEINEMIEHYFNYCFLYKNVDIDQVNGISHQFLRQVEYFRDAIKDEAALLDKVVGNNLICWAQSNRLNDQFEMPGGRRVKENNELLIGIFGFLNENDLIVANQICKKWNKLIHE